MKRILLSKKSDALYLPSFPETGHTSLSSNLWFNSECPILILVTESTSKSELMGEDLAALFEHLSPDTKTSFHLFEEIPESNHPDAFERNCERSTVLSLLKQFQNQSDLSQRLIIGTTPDALCSSCPVLEESYRSEIAVQCGAELHFQKFIADLAESLDYSSEILCEEPGQFATRGGLIDVYPVNSSCPYRIDFFGDEVEEIKIFDPTTQRSCGGADKIIISTCSNNKKSLKEGGFFEYIRSPVFWVFQEPELLVNQYPLCFHESEKKSLKSTTLSKAWGHKSRDSDKYVGFSEINAGHGIFLDSHSVGVEISLWYQPKRVELSSTKLSGIYEDEKRERVGKLFKLLKFQNDKNCEVIITIGAENEKKRIKEIIENESSLAKLSLRYLQVGLDGGFCCTSPDAGKFFSGFLHDKKKGIVFATSREILGRERSRRPLRSRKAVIQRKEVDQALDFSELVEGDYLVHHQHGICRFSKMGRVEDNSLEEESITLEFDDSILLHLPIQESHLLSRYVGLKKAKPKLAKLGGKTWAKIKSDAERAALDLAADLLRLQAKRNANAGFAFAKDDQWQEDFEDSFPYTETPDQQIAIEQVKEDMESAEPMDRLVCGDVGFGKTEVAIRAAFKAVMDGKQAAILAPTTILCQQHLNHFRERMSDFPVTIEMMSRFRTSSQQKKIALATACGSIDILIGTHRLLSKDINFKDLGLLIIDEEQRFGVQHKEAIKRLKANIDVLTLSATPIPRTLYFAMVGARSLSSIETAPTNRRPIRTNVVQGTDDVLRNAVNLEVRRGGQVFYLHNRVKTINGVQKKLEILFPKLRIAVGHGQMSEDELECVMTDFVAGEYDILVCTTIIESGLDIPNCNTIIIEGADKFGLSQLYQLRGRVGRFKRQAYAYLLVNQALGISEKARKRLSSIRQINSFGAGFRIALRDLELRGAGNLLGSEQSGHVAGVGFEMYCKLLKESVSRLKGDEISLRPNATTRLDFLQKTENENNAEGGYIPEDYISETRLRIDAYRKIASASSEDEVKLLGEEMNDRFGPLPDQVASLLLDSKIRCLAETADFDLVETKGNELLLRYAARGTAGERRFFRKLGCLPKLKESETLLKLNEIIQFLKLITHGRNN